MYNRKTIIVLVNLVYFEVGLMVSIIGALIPDIIKDFHLSYSAAAALPLSYYISFGIFAIPAGIVIEKFSYKKVLLAAYAIGAAGIIIFAYFKNYHSSIISLFIIGCSLTVAQVLALPLLREAVGGPRLAFHSTLNTFLYGVGAFVSPYFYTFLLHYLGAGPYSWSAVYWIFLLFFIITMSIIITVRFPAIHLNKEEKIGNLNSFRELLSDKYVYFYFIVLFSYAACEQGISNWISQFLYTYHAVNPQTVGAMVLSWYWLLLAVGCIAGMILLKYFESTKILFWFTIAAMVSLSCAVFGNTTVSILSFPLAGLFHSIMWPVILALAMNSVKKHHGSLSGLLFAASTGGAFGAMMVGRLGDAFGLRWGLLFLMVCYVLVATVPFWSKKNIKNKSIGDLAAV